ncbi:MAG: hypothetical protein ABI699_09305 [Caldimonas sp.]
MTLPADFDLVDGERKADVLLDRVRVESREHVRKRDRAFTNRDALLCLEFEALLVAVAASNLARGVALTDDDRARLWLAYGRMQAIVDEAVK